MNRLLPILCLLLFLPGCVERARPPVAVSFAKVDRRHQEAEAALSDARTHYDLAAEGMRALAKNRAEAKTGLDRVSASHSATAYGHAAEKLEIERLRAVMKTRFQNAPAQWNDAIAEVNASVTALSEANARTDAALKATGEDVETLRKVQDAGATIAQHVAQNQDAGSDDMKRGDAALAAEAVETQAVNLASMENAKIALHNKELADAAQARAAELEKKNWIRRALEAVAGLAILLIGIAWFTGKLTLAGTRAAAEAAKLAAKL